MNIKIPQYEVIQQTEILPLANDRASWAIEKYLHGEQRATDGYDVVVYVVDSGVGDHPLYSDRIIDRMSFTNNGIIPEDPHGGFVAGIIAASDPRIGLAPRVQLVDVRVLSKNGGTINQIVNGLKWILQHSKKHNKQSIVNMSLGAQGTIPALHNAIKALEQNDIILIAAAGNDTHHVDYPAALEEVIAVAATDKNENIAGFSSRGKQVLCSGPGVKIWSTSGKYGFAEMNGTSFAAPYVTGMIAKYLSR